VLVLALVESRTLCFDPHSCLNDKFIQRFRVSENKIILELETGSVTYFYSNEEDANAVFSGLQKYFDAMIIVPTTTIFKLNKFSTF
jgi:hypothetical protein